MYRARSAASAGLLLLLVLGLSSCNDDDGHPIYGFVDAQGDWVIPPQFDEVEPFSEGLAAAKEGERWGYVNVHGNWVIQPQFDDAEPFSEGAAVVKTGERYTYIDVNGAKLLDRDFSLARSFGGGVALVAVKGKWGLIDRRGALVPDPALDDIEQCLDAWSHWIACFSGGVVAARQGEQWGYLDRAGRWVIAPRFAHAGRFSEGLAAAAEVDGHFGYIDLRGHFVIAPKFADALWFSNGRAIVQLAATDSIEIAMIDATGGEVATIDWHTPLFGMNVDLAAAAKVLDRFPDYLADGLLPSMREGRWGYLDRDGQWAVEPQFDFAMPFQDGLAMIYELPRSQAPDESLRDDYLTGLIDTKGQWVAPLSHEAVTIVGDGRFVGTLNSRYGMRDRNMRWVADPHFVALIEEIGPSKGSGSFGDNGMFPAAVLAPHQWTVLDFKGRTVATGEFEWVSQLTMDAPGPDRFIVRQQGLYGIADARLKVQVSPQCEELQEGEDGLLEARLNNKVGCIDVAARWIVGADFGAIKDCRQGAITAKQFSAGWGIWAKKGGWLIKPEYESIAALWPGAYAVESGDRSRILRLSRGTRSEAGPEQLGGEYEEISGLMGSSRWTVKLDGKFAVIGPDSPVPVEFPIDEIDFKNSYTGGTGKNGDLHATYAVRSGTRWGLMDHDGRMITPFRFEAIDGISSAGIPVKLDGRWGVLDAHGRMIFPPQFEAVKTFSDKLVAFSEAGLWGLADRSGRIVISPRYSDISGRTVSIAKLSGVIDDTGREILKPIYQSASSFSDRVWIVKNGKNWQFIDSHDGSVIVEHSLSDRPWRSKDGLSSAKFVQGNGPARTTKIGFIDDRGRIVIAPRFDDTGTFIDGRARVTIGGRCGFIDRTGREVTPLRYSHCQPIMGAVLVGEELPYSDPEHTRTFPDAIGK